MLNVRVIPVLLLKQGRLVKPIRFGDGGERDVGDPVATARIYDSQDADELVFINIGSDSDLSLLGQTVASVTPGCFIPITAGGGIRSLAHVELMLKSGADKITLNTMAYRKPSMISEIANRFGSQCVVVSIDFRKVAEKKYIAYVEQGKGSTGITPVELAKMAEDNGAGEILLTSIDKEGTMSGYEIDIIKEVANSVNIPVIANGGAGSRADFVSAIKDGQASAVSASSVFHFSDSNITQVKSYLLNNGVPVRPL